MKRQPLRFFVVCAAFVMLFAFARPASAYDQTDFEVFCKEQFKRSGVRSGVALVSLNGERVGAFFYGPRTQKGGEIDENTCFRVASVTKFVTAIGLMTLYHQGAFELDSAIGEYLPMMPLINPAFPDTAITPRQLLSHTSSFRGDQSYTTPTWEKINRPDNAFYSARYAPGTHYEYSNLNGAMFGSMIESLSGKSLNTYMREAVFDPLGINAAYHPYLLRDTGNCADIFTTGSSMQILYEAELKRFENYHDTCDPRNNCGYSVGRMYISAAGLEKLLTLLLNDGALDGTRLLSAETVALMEAEQETLPDSSVSAESRYGLGMEHLHGQPGGDWYGHQGRTGNFTCDAYYQPDTGLTLVLIGTGYRYGVRDSMVTLALRFMEEAQKFAQ